MLKAHCREWGIPIGLVTDSGSANLSDASLKFLDSNKIKPVPSGLANPKGNGTIEGAFNHLKQVIGSIHIDNSSPEAMAKSVLQAVISVYIKMRNKLPSSNQLKTPTECMKIDVPDKNSNQVKKKLQNKIDMKNASGDDQAKHDILHCLIKNMKIKADATAVARARKTITFYA